MHKDIASAALECQPVSSRLISIRQGAAPFNITIIQVYAPRSSHDDNEVNHFYQQLQEIIDQTSKKGILVVQGGWNTKVRRDAQADSGNVCEPYCGSPAFIAAFFPNGSRLLREKVCSRCSKFFSLQVGPFSDGISFSR